MGGLKAIDLRDGAGDDDAHGVGHIVFPQGSGYGLFDDLPGAFDMAALYGTAVNLRFFFLFGWQGASSLFGQFIRTVLYVACGGGVGKSDGGKERGRRQALVR